MIIMVRVQFMSPLPTQQLHKYTVHTKGPELAKIRCFTLQRLDFKANGEQIKGSTHPIIKQYYE
jgi:hypothetical protein